MGVYYIGSIPCSGGDIYHFGRKGMKWGQTIFGDLADRLAKRGWGGASRVARGISTGFGRANEFINADFSRNAMNRGVTQARSAYNRTLPGMIDQARGAVGNAASAAREQAQQAMAKAREKVSTAYADAAAAIGKKGLDIQSFYSQVMQKAQGAINAGKNMVSRYGGQFVSQIQTLGTNALAGGKAFLDKAMERARNAVDTVTRKTKRAASLAKTFSEHPVAYTKHYVTSEKNKKKTKMDPNSLYYDKESGTTKAADSSRMVPKNHPEAQRHTRYIDSDGRVKTSETNTYMGYKHRTQDPGHLDPEEERAFARAKKRSNKR